MKEINVTKNLTLENLEKTRRRLGGVYSVEVKKTEQGLFVIQSAILSSGQLLTEVRKQEE